MLSLSGILRDRENNNLSQPPPTYAGTRALSGLGIFLPRNLHSSKSGGKSSSPSYRHKTFSFEDEDDLVSPPDSPQPEVIVLPNKGGLELVGSEDGNQVRSASSSYPSEAGGARSPELTVSPPMTFGRRILSSLEAYGFSNPHFASLQSESSRASENVFSEEKEAEVGGAWREGGVSEVRDGSAEEDGTGAVEGTGLEGVEVAEIVLTTTNLTVTDTEEGEIVDLTSEGTLRRYPRREDDEQEHMVGDWDEEDNLSTRCLPRVSINPDRVCLSEDNNSVLARGDYCGSKSSFPRNAVSGIKHHISTMNLKASPVKVKKWFVRQFRASRKGSRVIVKKVRERKARLRVNSGDASGGGGKRKGGMKGKGKRKPVGSIKILGSASFLTRFSMSKNQGP